MNTLKAAGRVLIALCTVLSFNAVANPQATPVPFSWYDGQWAVERTQGENALTSSVPMQRGRLANGLRWVVVPNEKGSGKVSVLLNVQVGSRMERADQAGFSHFLEHMAFNGTRRFPGNAINDFFREHGMQIGADVNARTSTDATVYELHLTRNDKASLKTALGIFRDVADGLTLSPEQIDQERGVILTEKAAKNSPRARSDRSWREFLYGNTPRVSQPIGTESVIKTVTSEALRRFYQTWYVPQRMVLVISGDVNPDTLKALINEEFASIPKAPTPQVATVGDVDLSGERFYVGRRMDGKSIAAITLMHPDRHRADNAERRLDEWCDAAAGLIVERRLKAITQRRDDSIERVFFMNGRGLDFVPTVGLSAQFTSSDWESLLALLDQELRRAKAHGVQPWEVEAVVADLEKLYQQKARLGVDRDNAGLARKVVRLINNDKVFLSYADEAALFAKLKKQMTVKRINAALQAALAPTNRRVSLFTAMAITPDQLRRAWEALPDTVPAAPPTIKPKEVKYEPAPFPYLTVTDKTVAYRLEKTEPLHFNGQHYETQTYRFANGTRAVWLPITFKDGVMHMDVLYGTGLSQLTATQAHEVMLAYEAAGDGSLGALSSKDVMYHLTVEGIRVEDAVYNEHGLISGTAPVNKWSRLLDALYTQYVDGRISPVGYRQALAKRQSRQTREQTSVKGALSTITPAFYAGQAVKAIPALHALKPESLKALNRIYKDQHADATPTIIVAGPVKPEKWLPAIGQRFAVNEVSSAVREQTAGSAKAVPSASSFPAGKTFTHTLKDTGAEQAIYRVAYLSAPTALTDRKTRMVRSLLAAVLRQQTRRVIREANGLAYGSHVSFKTDDTPDGKAVLEVTVQTTPEKVGAVEKAVKKMLNNFAADGVSASMLAQIKAPIVDGLSQRQKDPALLYQLWRNTLLDGFPYAAWYEESLKAIKRTTREDLRLEASQTLKADPATLIILSN